MKIIAINTPSECANDPNILAIANDADPLEVSLDGITR